MNTNRLSWFRWSPTIDVWVALLTEFAMIALYWSATHVLSRGWDGILVFGLLTNLVLNVLFPVWWIAWFRKQPISELGITSVRWLPSFLIGIGLTALSSYQLRQMAVGLDWLPHLIYNGVILWEPFFVFSWLQLRFDRAFGIIPALLLTGLCFAAYHVGTYPLSFLPVLFIIGFVYAVVFRLTSNLLIVWPFVWSVASSIGTLMGGMQFGWNQVVVWSIILIVQLIFIGFTQWMQNRDKPTKAGE